MNMTPFRACVIHGDEGQGRSQLHRQGVLCEPSPPMTGGAADRQN
jgi:hypothetical protein